MGRSDYSIIFIIVFVFLVTMPFVLFETVYFTPSILFLFVSMVFVYYYEEDIGKIRKKPNPIIKIIDVRIISKAKDCYDELLSNNVINEKLEKRDVRNAKIAITFENVKDFDVRNMKFYLLSNGQKCDYYILRKRKNRNVLSKSKMVFDFDLYYMLHENTIDIKRADCAHVLCTFMDSRGLKHEMIFGLVIKSEKKTDKGNEPIIDYFCRFENTKEFKFAVNIYKRQYDSLETTLETRC